MLPIACFQRSRASIYKGPLTHSLHCSEFVELTLYYILHGLKKLGAKISYSRTKKTFRYTNDFDLSMELKVSFIGEKELNVLGCGAVNATFVLDIPCNFIAWNV